MRTRIRLCVPALVLLSWTTGSSVDLRAQSGPAAAPSLRVIEARKSSVTAGCRAGAELLIDLAGNAVGCEFWEQTNGRGLKIVELRSGSRFEVEPLNATLVSAEGKTLLKFGDFSNVARRPGRSVAWILYSSAGKMLAEQPGSLDPDAAVAMADDGHFATVGRATEAAERDGTRLTLYSPAGARIFSKPLGRGVFATQIALRSGAQTIALTLTDAKRYRDGTTTIVLFAKSGDQIGTIPNVRYPNALLFAGPAGDRLLAVARGSLTLVQASTGKLLWKANRSYRLAGPTSATISPDGRYLCLISAELSGKPQDRYLWRAHLIAAAAGAPLATVDLPGSYAPGKMPVVRLSGERTISLTTADQDVITLGID